MLRQDTNNFLRFALARQALHSGLSVESAATAAGLGSARQLRRLWAECAGTTPGRERAAPLPPAASLQARAR